jgi:hypothetical protein
MSNSVTVTLQRPIESADGKTLGTLTFREADLGDLIAGDSFTGDTARSAAILASMAGIPYPVMKKVKAIDLAAILDQAGPLMGNAPQSTTGET